MRTFATGVRMVIAMLAVSPADKWCESSIAADFNSIGEERRYNERLFRQVVAPENMIALPISSCTDELELVAVDIELRFDVGIRRIWIMQAPAIEVAEAVMSSLWRMPHQWPEKVPKSVTIVGTLTFYVAATSEGVSAVSSNAIPMLRSSNRWRPVRCSELSARMPLIAVPGQNRSEQSNP